MIELPESKVIANQINETLTGKVVTKVIAASSPHKFAGYFGDPQDYDMLLHGKRITSAKGFGGLVEIMADEAVILFGDGVSIRYHTAGEKLPEKHQLLIIFDDNSALSASVRMYGGIWCFINGQNDNHYYKIAKQKPSPFEELFNEVYFKDLINDKTSKLTAKAFLATEQRIPGLGNGVLQDILWKAKVHPKARISSLNDSMYLNLFTTVKSVLYEMADKGGRDIEKDIFGKSGGYDTVLSSKNVGKPCPFCGEIIKKEAYLGGSIYYCSGCQK